MPRALCGSKVGGHFLMSEVPLYEAGRRSLHPIQGYLAHEKPPPRSTQQEPYA
jgi:hypothetical protein